MARMAYKVGDIDTYNYACSILRANLWHHYVKQRGADYFPQESTVAFHGVNGR